MSSANTTRLAPESNKPALGEAAFRFPTTLAQQALWYLDRLEPGNPAWNIAVRFRIRGALDASILDRAINEIVRRHEILRTTFSFLEGAPSQIVHTWARIPLPVENLSDLPAQQRDAEEERRTIAEGEKPFDLKTGPLIRSRLLRLADRDHMLIVTMHHIVSDGWSIGIFSDEVGFHYAAFLEAKPSVAPTLPFQYADYAVWKAERERSAALEEHRAYWSSKLTNLPACEIPPDHERPPLKTHNGYILSTVLPEPLSEALSNFSQEHGCTLFTTCLTALKMFIAHHTQTFDIYVGTLLAGRERVELENLIGVFINTIVLRTDLSGDPTFLELLSRVRATIDEGIAHQDLHFQQVVEVLRPKRDLSRPTLYGINFIYQRDFVKPIEFCGLSMAPVPSKSPGAIYDLNFFMVRRSDGWRLSCEYNADLYEPESINRMLGQIRSLFEQLVHYPEKRLSQFSYSSDAAEPLPAFVPRSGSAQAHEYSSSEAAVPFRQAEQSSRSQTASAGNDGAKSYLNAGSFRRSE